MNKLTEGEIFVSAELGLHCFEGVRAALTPDGKSTTKPVTLNFYVEFNRELSYFAGRILVMLHSFSEAWRMWEMHPVGDEIVVL